MRPSEKIQRIYKTNSKTANTAHKRLDATAQYLDEELPQRIVLAAQITGSLLSGGKVNVNDAVRIGQEAADKLLGL